jgi:phosphoglycolate phosphatase
VINLGPIDGLAFDLDGTLVDSAPDIAAALNAALTGAGLTGFELATVRRWIGDGPDALIARSLVQQGLAQAPESLRARLRRDFDSHTLAAPLAFGEVYPGIADLLARLQGFLPLAVVTNKPTQLARAVLEATGLRAFIASVHGADTAELRKPAPTMLLEAAHRLTVRRERLLMVGDSAADMLAARNAGCPAALAMWGYGAEAVPAELNLLRVTEPAHVLHALLDRADLPTHCRSNGV